MKTSLIIASLFFSFSIFAQTSYTQDVSKNTAEFSFNHSNLFFSSSKNRQGALSIDSRYFSFLREMDSYSELVFIDTDTLEELSAIRLSDEVSILDYSWVGDNYIKMSTRYRNNNYDYLYHLTKRPPEEPLANKEPSTDENAMLRLDFDTSRKKLPNGYLVTTLDKDTNGNEWVLFAKKPEVSKRKTYGKKAKQNKYTYLYKVMLTDLFEQNFDRAVLVDTAPLDLLIYFYDNSADKILGLFADEAREKITVKTRSLSPSKWTMAMSIEIEEFSLYPVGFIDDDNFAVLTNKDTDHIVLQRYNIERQSLEEILFQHPRYDLTNASLSENGTVESVEYILNGLPYREWLDTDSQAVARRFTASFEGQKTSIIAESEDNRKIIFLVEGPNNPGSYYLYRNDSDDLTKLIELDPKLNDIKPPIHSVVKATADDGAVIEGYLTTPSGFNANTLLVMPHGGPIGIRDYNYYSPEVQYYANRGFSVLRVNFRGSEGFGKEFREQGVAQFGKRIESDISTVVDKVLGANDFSNVCSIGASYGGYSSFMLAHKHKEIYDCVVAAYGVYDLPLLFNYSNFRQGEDYEEYIARVVGKNNEELKSVSPIYYANEINVPILLIAGKKDEISGFEQSNRMRFILEQQNKDVEHVFYNKIGHGHRSWYGQRHEAAVTSEFLFRRLNISLPDTNQLSEGSKDALSYDAMLIADSFDDSTDVNENKEFAFDNLKRAVELGHARGTFNMGSFYHRGDMVEKNLETALEYYILSGERGHDGVNYRVASIYSQAFSDQYNEDKAVAHFTLAAEEDDSQDAKNQLALMHCTSIGKYKNPQKCYDDLFGLFKDGKNTRERQPVVTAMATAITTSGLSAEEKAPLSELIVHAYTITHPEFQVKLESEGIYIYEHADIYGQANEYKLSTVQALAALPDSIEKSDVAVGVRFTPDHRGFAGLTKRTFVIDRWAIFDETGTQIGSKIAWRYDNATQSWFSSLSLSDYRPGYSYQLTISDAYGKKMYEATFR